jgi:NAD(P)-dependent dehydrogenase (short-subunit alcohol dehydrogenase family)
MSMRSILITGCSWGIGLASAREMKSRGWRVFATARKAQDIARLRNEVGVDSLYLDYAEPRSIAEAAEQVLKATDGKLTALFNNGAYGQPGAVEDLKPDVCSSRGVTHLSTTRRCPRPPSGGTNSTTGSRANAGSNISSVRACSMQERCHLSSRSSSPPSKVTPTPIPSSFFASSRNTSPMPG